MTTLRATLGGLAAVDRPGLVSRQGTWTWQAYVDGADLRARSIAARLDPARPSHVGVLLDNTPEMAFQLAAAGLGGHVIVGLNTTRRGSALARDVALSHCQFVITSTEHEGLLEAVDVPVLVDPAWERIDHRLTRDELEGDDLFMLIFTSGTGGEPKAVRVTHEKVSFPGIMLADRFRLSNSDVCYVSMPLFHSNATMAGWGVALAAGATIALGTKFSARGFLDDVRDFGATYANYVGKPLAHILATAERSDDADNPLRIVFGNEAGERDIAEFGRRFGCVVVDGFGSTENAVIITRVPGTPAGSLGMPYDGVAVLDPETQLECPVGVIGELVNTTGPGQFAGYYNDEAANAERMRGGMYWSGDLAWRDADGFAFYAGRSSDWLRVDGENLAAAPLERLLLRHPSISEAVVYAVPDPSSGDQLVAALVLKHQAGLSPTDFEEFLGGQEDLGAKSWPRHVLIADALPRTATNKVLKRVLRDRGLAAMTWRRAERGTSYAEVG